MKVPLGSCATADPNTKGFVPLHPDDPDGVSFPEALVEVKLKLVGPTSTPCPNCGALAAAAEKSNLRPGEANVCSVSWGWVSIANSVERKKGTISETGGLKR